MAPIRVMTGLEPDNPLDIVVYNPGSIAISSVKVSTEAIAKSVEDLQQSMDAFIREFLGHRRLRGQNIVKLPRIIVLGQILELEIMCWLRLHSVRLP